MIHRNRFATRKLQLLALATVIAGGLQSAAIATAADPADSAKPKDWQPGQLMDFRVVHAQTHQPIAGVRLELQNMGPGIDFQDVKVQTTDAEGRSAVKLPDLPPTAVRVYPSKPGFVPLRVYWEGMPAPDMPESITIPLQPGKAFGGIIRNEAGDPIPDVKVSVHYWGRGSGENPHLRANIDAVATSDKQGRWQVDVMPSEVDEDQLRIYVNHPDYISDHLRRAIRPIPVIRQPSLETLFARSAVMTMRLGETIQGRVVDEQGKPIAGAKIFDCDYYWFEPAIPRATADQNGEFRIVGAKPGSNVLTIQARGYVPELLDVAGARMPVEFKLATGNIVRGKVIDPSGMPIAGASVNARSWRGQSNRLDLSTKTNAEGEFRLVDAPADDIEYDVGKEGYMMAEDVIMSPSQQSYSITLKAPLKIVGSVVDADTGKPIDQFTMLQGVDYDDGRAPSWLNYTAQKISAGRYEFTVKQEGFFWRVRVEADRYLPAESRMIRPYAPDQGTLTFDFRLSKADPLTGTVFGLEGQPLEGAEVYLATQRMNLHEGKVTSTESPPVKTDPAGNFSFAAEVEPYCLVVVHETGLAMLTEEQFAESALIRIKPWDKYPERLQIIRRPAKNQHVDFP